MRLTPLMFVLLAGVVLLLFLFQFEIVSLAFDKLGLSGKSALLLAVTAILGSLVNLPVARLGGRPESPPAAPGVPCIPDTEYGTLLAVNVGGCLVPVGFCVYLFSHAPLDPVRVFIVVAAVAAVSYRFSRPVPGAGIAISAFVPPLTAALFAVLLDPERAPPTAYIGGTLGVLVGADLLKINSLRWMRAPVASIGGAGTFDGVFITGILAVLLA